MNIYLAGKWEEAPVIQVYAKELRALGHTILAPWFERPTVGPTADTTLREEAYVDVEGIALADAAIFIFEKQLPYSGALTEFGIAIACGVKLIVVGHGADRNIFMHLDEVEKVEDFHQCLAYLETLKNERPTLLPEGCSTTSPTR